MVNYVVIAVHNGVKYSTNMPEDSVRKEFVCIEDAIDEFATLCISYGKYEKMSENAEEKELVELFLVECGSPLDYTMVHKSFLIGK